MSNPDLLRDNSTTAGQGPAVESDQRTEYPEHVLKVYKSDQVKIKVVEGIGSRYPLMKWRKVEKI
jgi:hypothetical protein